MKWATLPVCVLLLFEAGTAHPGSQLRGRHRGPPEYYRAFQTIENKGRFSRVVLRNGLTVLIEEQSLLPLVAVATYVKAGRLQERPSGLGAARVLESMLGQSWNLAERTRKVGGMLRTSTGWTGSGYVSLLPSDNVLEGLEIHSDLLKTPHLEAPAVKSILLSLRREEEESLRLPRVFARKLLWHLAYAGQGPAQEWDGVGSPAPSEASTAAREALAFHRTNYRPNHVIVSISGAVLRENILPRIVKLYAQFQNSGQAQPSVPALSPRTPASFQYRHLRGEVAEPYLLFGYRIPGRRHPDYYPVLLLSALLGEGRGSLLERSRRNDNSILEVSTRCACGQEGGLLEVRLTPRSDVVDRAEVQVLGLVEALRKVTAGPLDLDRTKAWLLRKHYQRLQSLERRALLLARYEALGSYQDLEREPDRLRKVTAQQVRQAAAHYLVDSNLSLLEYFPREAEPRRFTSESLLETLHLLVPAAARKQADEMQALKTQQPETPFSVPEFRPNFFSHDLKKTSVLRGPDIYLEEEHSLPLVFLGFFYPGGRIEEAAPAAGITELMLRLLLGSMAAGDPLAWAKLESLGAEFSIVNQPDFFGFQATVLSSHMPALFETLVKWLRLPELNQDEGAFQAEKRRLLSALGRQRKNPGTRVLMSLNQRLFGDHPYALSRYGSEATLDSLTSDQVRDWIKDEIQGIHPVIVVYGDVQGTSFLPDLIPLLGNSKFRRKARVTRNPSNLARMTNAFYRGKGSVVGAFPGPVRGARDDWVLEALENLVFLSGQLPSTEPAPGGLFTRLQLSHQSRFSGGAIFVQARVPLGREEEGEQVLKEQLAQLKGAALRESDLKRALVLAISKHYASRQVGTAHVLELARNLIGGEKAGYQREYLSTLRSLQVEDLRAVGERFFKVPPEPKGEGHQTDPGWGSSCGPSGSREMEAISGVLLPPCPLDGQLRTRPGGSVE
ncbi:MAG: M16 family metallopeptidase [Acidobacteriota bacterium]